MPSQNFFCENVILKSNDTKISHGKEFEAGNTLMKSVVWCLTSVGCSFRAHRNYAQVTRCMENLTIKFKKKEMKKVASPIHEKDDEEHDSDE
jgi:hypothetical protein